MSGAPAPAGAPGGGVPGAASPASVVDGSLVAVLDHLPDAVIRVDPDGRIRLCNEAARRLLGRPDHEVLGRRLCEIAVAGAPTASCAEHLQAAIASGEPASYDVDATVDGGRRRLRLRIVPEVGSHGAVESLLVVGTDISALHDLLAALDSARAELEQAERLGEIGSWHHELNTDRLVWSPECFRIWGIPPAERPDPRLLVARLSSFDLDALQAAQRAAENGRPAQTEHRVLLPDDSVRWVLTRMEPVFDATGRQTGVRGVCQDVTERRRLERDLRAERAGLRAVIEASPVAVLRLDRFGEVLDANVRAYELVGLPPGGLAGMQLEDIGGLGELGALWATALRRAVATRAPCVVEGELTGPGAPRWIEATFAPEDGASDAERVVCLARDTTSRRITEQALARTAVRDPLTGLANRRLLVEALTRDLAALGRRPGRFLAVLALDLDGFKAVNDRLGHAAGDALLVAVGARIAQAVRPEDLVARLGGDEFVVLLSDVDDLAEAVEVGERVRHSLAEAVPLGPSAVRVSTSVGVALAGSPSVVPDDLVQRADLALYEAKHTGRDRVVAFDEALDARMRARGALAGLLQRALPEGLLVPRFQPVVRIPERSVVGVETLLALRDGDGGVLPAGQFVDLARVLGHLAAFDLVAVEAAAAAARRWAGAGIVVRANLSAAFLAQEGAAEHVLGVARAHGVPAASLGVDVRADVLAASPGGVVTEVAALSRAGVQLWVDHVGSTPQVVGQLAELDAHGLVLEAELVGSVGERSSGAVVSAIVASARYLGLEVVGVGVERASQLTVLAGLGCDLIQGHLVGRPSTEAAVDEALGLATTG